MKTLNFNDAKKLNSIEIRNNIRNGSYVNHTAGLAKNNLQTNIVILPKQFSIEFTNFCKLNTKACPLVAKTETGIPVFSNLGEEIDIRYDVPSYNVYKNGELTETLNNIEHLWNDNLVAFAIGCSFTFEHQILKHNIQIDHINNNKIVPMYRTNIKNSRSGIFGGQLVASMRIFKNCYRQKIIDISKKFLSAHGEPIHIGDFKFLGINDIFSPDWGDKPRIKNSDESYFFWACGVTPQNVVMEAKLPFCITHTPGHMLITDIFEKDVTPI